MFRISVPRPKSWQVEDGEAQCWAFLRDSDSPATMEVLADNILADRNTEDVAIMGLSDKCTWAAKPGGLLAAISPQEVGLITGQQRKMFLLTGITIAGKKRSAIRGSLLVDEDNVMDIRSKGSDSRSICTGKHPKALTFLMVKKGVHRGALSQKVHDTIVSMKA